MRTSPLAAMYQPTGFRQEDKVLLPFPPWRDPWCVQAGRNDPKRGQEWILRRGSREKRVTLSLGWIPRADADICARGMNALCRARAEFNGLCVQAVGKPMLPPDPPVTLFALPVPVGVGGRTIPSVSDDWLVAVKRAAATPEQKDVALTKIVGFLRHMAETEPAPAPLAASPTGLLAAVRLARTGIDPGSLTLAEYVPEYWAPVRRAANEDGWRKESGLIRLHVEPSVGHVAMRDIDPRDLFACARDAKLLDGKLASHRTRSLILSAVRVMFKSAWENKHVDRMPDFGGLQLKGSTIKPLAQKSLTGQQLTALLGAAANPRDRAMLAVMFGTGGRPEEIVTLDWSMLTWPTPTRTRHPHGTIHLRGTKTTRADRTIPMMEFAHHALRAYWTEAGQPASGALFRTRSGVRYAAGDGASYYRAMLRNAADRAKLSDVRVTPYTARHTFATLMRGMGVSAEKVRALMGHTPNSRTLEKSYDHNDPLAAVAGKELPDLRLARAADHEN